MQLFLSSCCGVVCQLSIRLQRKCPACNKHDAAVHSPYYCNNKNHTRTLPCSSATTLDATTVCCTFSKVTTFSLHYTFIIRLHALHGILPPVSSRHKRGQLLYAMFHVISFNLRWAHPPNVLDEKSSIVLRLMESLQR